MTSVVYTALVDEVAALVDLLDSEYVTAEVVQFAAELGLASRGAEGQPALTADLAEVWQDLRSVGAAVRSLREQLDPADVNPVRAAQALGELAQRIAQLPAHVSRLAAAMSEALESVPGLSEVERARRTEAATEFVQGLLGAVGVAYLETRYRKGFRALVLLGVIEVNESDDGFQRLSQSPRVHFERLHQLCTEPRELFADVYGWGRPDFDGLHLFETIATAARWAGARAVLTSPAGAPACLDLFGAALCVQPGAPPGLVLSLRHALTTGASFDDTRGGWRVRVATEASLPTDVDVELRPPLALSVLTPGLDINASLRAVADRLPAASPELVLGSDDGASVRIDAVKAEAWLDGHWSTGASPAPLDAGAAIAAQGVRVTVPASNSFVAATLGEALSVVFDAGASWSLTRGFSFSGGGGLEIEVPVGRGMVESIRLRIEFGDRGLAASAAVVATVALGPVTATVGGLGAEVTVRAADGAGALGPLDVVGRVRAPDEIGLMIRATGVSGGGRVRNDLGLYTGTLALDVLGVSLSAHGLLDARGPGYSLAAVIAAEFRPIPLPLGFTLEGVGGLIGVHRRVDTAALRAALRTPAGMGDLFFPADPIAQAARLTTDLARYFPAAEGRYVFGPAVKFGWGTPTVVRGALAVLLELPAPARVVVLGTVTAKLPTEEQAIVDLAMDVVGEVDFGQKRVAVDASLRSSTIARFPITGDLAFRLSWGSPRSFALAIGGFHSQFRPPADFPTLRRVRIELGSGDDPRLDAEGFLALTSNTLQMGARIDLYASAGPLNIVGGLGFETLVQFSPFGLAVDVWAGVKLRRGTSTLAAVSFDGHLQGPKPWRVDGKACLSLWFIDLCVPIHVTFGHGAPAALPSRAIWPALQTALADPSAWAAEVPRGLAAVVAGPPVDADESPTLVDPCATLSVTQQVVPLDRTITAYAQGRPTGVDRFHVTEVRVGGAALPPAAVTPVMAWFAPAQFEAMSEADKLSRPGFEEMVAGVAVGATTVQAGAPLVRALDYDTVVIAGEQRQEAERYRPSFDQQLIATALSATALAPGRRGGAEAYAPAVGALPALTLAEETFVIATTDALAPRWDLTAAATRGQAELALRAHLAAHPGDAARLQVVPSYEVAA